MQYLLVLLELGEMTVLAMVHQHIGKVHTREAYLKWKVQFAAKMDCGTDAFQLFWGHADLVVFLCSVYKTMELLTNYNATSS